MSSHDPDTQFIFLARNFQSHCWVALCLPGSWLHSEFNEVAELSDQGRVSPIRRSQKDSALICVKWVNADVWGTPRKGLSNQFSGGQHLGHVPVLTFFSFSILLDFGTSIRELEIYFKSHIHATFDVTGIFCPSSLVGQFSKPLGKLATSSWISCYPRPGCTWCSAFELAG